MCIMDSFYEVYDDNTGDLTIEYDNRGHNSRIFICAKKDAVIPAGEMWKPKTSLRSKIGKFQWQIVRSVRSSDNHVSVLTPQRFEGDPLQKLAFIGEHGKDVHVSSGQRIAEIEIRSCKRISSFQFNHVHMNSDDERDVVKCAAAAQSCDSDATDVNISMPVYAPTEEEHRPRLIPAHVYSACVARPVTKKEAQSNPKAMAALDKEWTKLRNIKRWDEDKELKSGVLLHHALVVAVIRYT